MDLNEMIFLGAATLIAGNRISHPPLQSPAEEKLEMDSAIYMANKLWLRVRQAEDEGKLGSV